MSVIVERSPLDLVHRPEPAPARTRPRRLASRWLAALMEWNVPGTSGPFERLPDPLTHPVFWSRVI